MPFRRVRISELGGTEVRRSRAPALRLHWQKSDNRGLATSHDRTVRLTLPELAPFFDRVVQQGPDQNDIDIAMSRLSCRNSSRVIT